MLIDEKALDELARIVSQKIPDDQTGSAQIAMTLIHELRETRKALAEAAIPLEALAICLSRYDYRELSPQLKNGVGNAIKIARTTLFGRV